MPRGGRLLVHVLEGGAGMHEHAMFQGLLDTRQQPMATKPVAVPIAVTIAAVLAAALHD